MSVGVIHPTLWKSIVLGKLSSIEAYREALLTRQNRITWEAGDLFKKTQVSEKEIEVKLAKVTVGSLGLKGRATLKEIIPSAERLGLGLCPAEVGPGLRLAYENQPDGENLMIAMGALTGYDGMYFIFRVRKVDNVRWLGCDCAEYCTDWPPDQSFIFQLCE